MKNYFMKKQLHVVLGGAGSIGQAVLKELFAKNIPARAVERSREVSGVETIKADLLYPVQTLSAIKGASHVYLCVGIPYYSKVWAAEWPIVMKNIISACEKASVKLIFFDNAYMYGPAPLLVPYDETHKQEPSSQKWKTRKLIADMLLEAHRQGKIKAVIGRSSDFYGPGAVNSMLYSSLLERMLKGKAPQSLAKPGVKHTFAYTEDNGRALVALALDDGAYGEVWHLPAGTPITTEEVVEYFNKELKTNLKPQFISPLFRRFLGMFIPILREAGEMNYQFETDYIMSFEKFKNRFPNFNVMPMEEGLQIMTKSFRNHV